MEVDYGGLEEDVLNGDDEGLEGVEYIGRVFLGPILFVGQPRGDFKLDLIVGSAVKFDGVVRTLLWPFRRGNHFLVIIVQRFVKVGAFAPRLRGKGERRQYVFHGLRFAPVSRVHDSHFLLHEVLSHERVVGARAAILDKAGGAATRSEMFAKLFKCLRELLICVFINPNDFGRINIVHHKERGLVVHVGMGPLLHNFRPAKFEEEVGLVQQLHLPKGERRVLLELLVKQCERL